ncbi:MAG: CHAT domain-containing protein [Chromatiales bacterium]|nr:CHAT domain-containing protein [Chromatiales bacterium]
MSACYARGVDYANFEVIVSDGPPGAYPVYVMGTRSRAASGTLALDPTADEWVDALARLEDRHRTDREFLAAFGRELYRRLLAGEPGELFEDCFREVKGRNHAGIRLRLRITPPALAALPWELLYSDRERNHLASLARCSLVRFMASDQPAREIDVNPPLRMLVCIAQAPPPWPQLDVEAERTAIEETRRALGDRVEVRWLEGAITAQAIATALVEHDVDCFHFIGHGERVGDSGALVLCDGNGDAAPLGDAEAAEIFGRATGIKLMMLNACKGASRSSTDSIAGIAPALVQAGVPAVVAMQHTILDEAAVLFARSFYECFFGDANLGLVDVAVSHARGQIGRRFPSQRDFAMPVVFLRTETGLLLSVPGRTPAAASAAGRARLQAEIATREALVADAPADSPRRTAQVERIAALRGRLRRHVLAVLAGVGALAATLVALWLALFDPYDLRLERITLALGHALSPPTLHADIAFVRIDADSEARYGQRLGPSWRALHARVVDALAEAGASTIVFDGDFAHATTADDALAAAIDRAASRAPPTRVVLGYTDLWDEAPAIAPRLRASRAHTGVACFGGIGSLARTMPAIAIDPAGARPSRPSLALAAFVAHRYRGAAPRIGLAVGDASLHLGAAGGLAATERRLFDTEVRTATQDDNACPALAAGDVVGSLMLDPVPAASLRETATVVRYEDLLDDRAAPAALAALRGRAVVVGYASTRDDFALFAGSGERRFGYELHADALNSLLTDRAIRPAGTAVQLGLMLALVVATVAVSVVPGWSGRWPSRLGALAVAAVGLAVALVAYLVGATLFDSFYLLVAVATAHWLATRTRRWLE